jgi:drug/metabolite transporter (DMT)-like permease
MAWSFLFALPVLGLACLFGPGLPALTAETLAFGGWVGLVEMGVTFLLWQRALKRTANAARIGQLIFLSPFISLVLIGAVLGETVHATSWIGLAVIVAGLLLARRQTVVSP